MLTKLGYPLPTRSPDHALGGQLRCWERSSRWAATGLLRPPGRVVEQDPPRQLSGPPLARRAGKACVR